MKINLFDYNLPKELIAQKPAYPRDNSRLLVLDRKTKKIQHKRFYDLPNFLKKDDVLVFNNSKVFPARLWVKKETGGKLEVFLLNQKNNDTWQCLLGGKVRRIGLEFSTGRLKGKVIKKLNGGIWLVRFNLTGNKFWQQVFKHGVAPTPPYIKKLQKKDKVFKDYQTIYAKKIGSVAAPTAGFHFTKKLLKKLKKMGIQLEFVTLHVGYGTFQPVKVNNIEKHKMHPELVEVKKDVLERLKKAKKEKRRIIAVGTTTVRVLETIMPQFLTHKPYAISHKLINTFIYPGYKFKFVDCLITNFHLPRSTLLMLVSAFIDKKNGIKIIKKVYLEAIKKKYRFYSFGEAMLIL
jgi:S-adenosylmethionine:tRNA ribosyltransferase-isomerase